MYPVHRSRPAVLTAGLACVASLSASAATSVVLDGAACAHPDTVYASRFEGGERPPPSDASNGAGGTFPGSLTRTLHVAGLGSGTQDYYLYVPSGYTPGRPVPLLLALHGVAQYGDADNQARAIRDAWSGVAEAGGFIVAAPVADAIYYQNGAPYAVTWLVPQDGSPNDYDLFDALRADMEGAYDIERTRVYGWGFSAGGHIMHDLAFGPNSTAFNAGVMAAYGVSGADLAAQACYGLTSAACDQLLLAAPRKIPVDIHIGNSDPNFPYAKADHLRFVADGWVDHASVFYNVFVGGHEYTVAQLGQIWSNLCPNAVTP